ncbi:unnamed protein product, partial [Heterotrigona itama]
GLWPYEHEPRGPIRITLMANVYIFRPSGQILCTHCLILAERFVHRLGQRVPQWRGYEGNDCRNYIYNAVTLYSGRRDKILEDLGSRRPDNSSNVETSNLRK